jgi:hypothetical protein
VGSVTVVPLWQVTGSESLGIVLAISASPEKQVTVDFVEAVIGASSSVQHHVRRPDYEFSGSPVDYLSAHAAAD